MSAPQLTVYVTGEGTVGGDQLNTFCQTCNIMADLRAFTGISGIEVFVRGTSAINDGGQGMFYWNATGTAPDDNGVTTVVPFGATAGEWTRQPLIGNLGPLAFATVPLSTTLGGTGKNQFSAISGTVKILTATYTVPNSEAGDTYVLTGNAYYPFNVGAPSGYDPDFLIKVICFDGRGKQINISGITPFILWPGQTIEIQSTAGGSWAVSPTVQRWDFTATGATFNVDAVSGNDSGDGLGTGAQAFKTILYAWNLIRDQTLGEPTIQLVPGQNYGPSGELDGDKSTDYGRLVHIVGDPTGANPAKILGNGSDVGLTLRDGAWVSFLGIEFGSNGSTSTGVSIQQKALGDFSTILWGSQSNGNHIQISDGGKATMAGPQTINAAGTQITHIDILNGGALVIGSVTYTIAAPVTFSAAFLAADQLVRIFLQAGVTFNGAGSVTGSQYAITHGTMLSLGGNTLPGSTGGTADATSVAY